MPCSDEVDTDVAQGACLNFHSVEHLNSLTYYNYGDITSSNGCDLSSSNRLALCTDKCIFILSYNFMWPLSILNCSPAKFLNDLNQEPKITHSSSSAIRNSEKNKLQIDSWKRDLHDSKNEAFYLNIIRSIKKSQRILDVYLSYFSIDEVLKKSKSFHKNLTDMINLNKRFFNQERLSMNVENKNVETCQEKLKEANKEQFNLHKHLCNQTLVYDSYYCDYLGKILI